MARMYGSGKGIAGSSLPYRRTPPAWLKTSTQDVVKTILALAKKGLAPSAIGMELRDSMGVASVKNLTGRKILRILKAKKAAPELPEDLTCLIKRAVSMRKHLDKNRRDIDTKFRLILVESRIHRLARYYKSTKQVAANFKYESATASTLVAA
eukprot:GILI01000504.1.p1 GENE.GILI01000504.1~~GILI01000504.1.p1  ORF type:complete len:153 (+),score=63.83 GILI01000504.1:37-495(+)